MCSGCKSISHLGKFFSDSHLGNHTLWTEENETVISKVLRSKWNVNTVGKLNVLFQNYSNLIAKLEKYNDTKNLFK